jgi:hypothetical protein
MLLSSRAEEEILKQLSGASKITLAPDATRDALIVEKTVESRLDLPADTKALVTGTLSRLAQGCAIWSVIVTRAHFGKGRRDGQNPRRNVRRMAPWKTRRGGVADRA